MKCPQCKDTALVMSERQGIEIDYCPQCRGIWLDRGELDKLIEKASLTQSHVTAQTAYVAANSGPIPERVVYRDVSRHRHYKQKSWLNEIFD
ncbi:MAG: zf-TFIIB domain-containing protein [Limnohabitans sp.]